MREPEPGKQRKKLPGEIGQAFAQALLIDVKLLSRLVAIDLAIAIASNNPSKAMASAEGANSERATNPSGQLKPWQHARNLVN